MRGGSVGMREGSEGRGGREGSVGSEGRGWGKVVKVV